MSDYRQISKIYIASNVILQTKEWLREAGRTGDEAFVLWSGAFIKKDIFVVNTAIFPEQKAFQTPQGVGVYVSGDEIFRINRWLYDNSEILIAQVHSHPTDAYHSDTDDNFPLVTEVGQFSIVVPYFARRFADLSNCAVYRLRQDGKWVNVSRDVKRFFEVVK